MAGFVLEYRHHGRGYQHPAPLQDAQRAIQTVRARADEFKVDPKRIGILGFSAGGHLASTAGTHFDRGDASAADPIAKVSCRPDFMVLCYAVIAFGEPYTHGGSQMNLLGKDPQDQSAWAAFVAPAENVGGRYCEDCQVSQVTDALISPVSPGVRPYALDPERAKALWAKSEELVDEHF